MTPAPDRRARALVRAAAGAAALLAAALVLGPAWSQYPSPGPSAPSAPRTVALGPSALADGVLNLSPPGAPTGLSATAHDRSLALSWDAVTATGNPVVSYTVYLDGTAVRTVAVPTTSTTLTGLSNYRSYSVQVTARDNNGTSGRESSRSGAVSAVPYDDVPPSPVTGLTATRGDGRATLTWEPESATEADRAGVRVYVDGALHTSLPAATTTYDVTGLTNDRKYSFYLVAYDARPGGYGPPGSVAPNESARSATVQATPTDLTPPSAPTAFTAVRGDARATVTWTASPEGDVDHYEVVDETGARRASFNVPATSGTVGGLTNGQAYRLRLVAVDTHGNHSPASAEVVVTPAKPPVVRTGLRAAPGDRQVSLSWDPPGTDAQRAVATSIDVLVDRVVRTTVAGTATTVTVTGLTNGTRYDFSLIAVDAEGRTSPESPRVQATPVDLTPPATPTGVFAARGDGSAAITWQPVGDGDLAGYRVVVTDASGTVVSTIDPATSPAQVTGLADGQPYRARVVAYDALGNTSPPSAEVAFTPLAPPPAVSGLALTMDGDDAVLTWTAPAVPPPAGREAAADVVVVRVGSPDVRLAVLGPGATTYRVTGLAAGEPASFYLLARDGDPRDAAPSTTVSTRLRAPLGVGVVSGDSSATLSWAAVPGAAGYRVEQRLDADGSPWTTAGSTGATSLRVDGLTNTARYRFRVVALPTSGPGSPPSAEVVVTVGYAPPTTVPAAGSGDAVGVAASRDGRYAVVAVAAGSGRVDLVRVDRRSADRVTVAAGIAAAEPAFARAAVSDDGRYVALLTRTSHSPRVTNGRADVYRYDTVTGAWALVSAPAGTAAQLDTTAPVPGLTDGAFTLPSKGPQLAITADGSRVFFASARTNLVAGDTNGAVDLFVKDLSGPAAGTVTRVTPATGLTPTGTGFAVTPDGAYVLYTAGSGGSRSLVRQSVAAPAERVLVTDGLGNPLGPSAGVGQLAISDDGTRVVATTLSGSASTVVQADLTAPAPPPAGAPAGTPPSVRATAVATTDYGDGQVGIVPAGTHVFLTTKDALVGADTNGHVDLYRVDLADPSSRVLVTVGPDGGPAAVPGQGGATLDEAGAVVVRDADHVVVVTQRPLVAADGNGKRDAYAVDLTAPPASRAEPLVGGP